VLLISLVLRLMILFWGTLQALSKEARYGAGFTKDSPVVKWFWEVVGYPPACCDILRACGTATLSVDRTEPWNPCLNIVKIAGLLTQKSAGPYPFPPRLLHTLSCSKIEATNSCLRPSVVLNKEHPEFLSFFLFLRVKSTFSKSDASPLGKPKTATGIFGPLFFR
jgi:hypothetical protein